MNDNGQYFKLTKEDIGAIAANNLMEVDFARWIGYLVAKLVIKDEFTEKNEFEIRDSITALTHLQHIYEKKERVSLRFIKSVREMVNAMLWLKENEYSLERKGKATKEDVTTAEDIYFLLWEVQKYLDFNTHNYIHNK